MTHIRPNQVLAPTILIAWCAPLCVGDVVHFDDRSTWEQSFASFTTIGFDDVPSGSYVTEQYASLGIHFTDGTDRVFGESYEAFPRDGFGLYGFYDIHVSFDAPVYGIGADFPGALRFTLISDGQTIYESPLFGAGPIFVGLLSSVAFDEAIIDDWDVPSAHAVIDDLHFGPAIPAPSVIALLALAAVGPRRRRSM